MQSKLFERRVELAKEISKMTPDQLYQKILKDGRERAYVNMLNSIKRDLNGHK